MNRDEEPEVGASIRMYQVDVYELPDRGVACEHSRPKTEHESERGGCREPGGRLMNPDVTSGLGNRSRESIA